VIALRCAAPDALPLPVDSVTEVRGWRAAAALLMYRPEIALRFLAMVDQPFWEAQSRGWNRITGVISPRSAQV
jgi:hypothetical protein